MSAATGTTSTRLRSQRVERDELVILNELVPLGRQQVIELGCGGARLLRDLLRRFPDAQATGLEVDAVQHAKNLADRPSGCASLPPAPRRSRCRMKPSTWR